MSLRAFQGTAIGAKPTPLGRRWWVLLVVSLATLMIFMDNTVVNTALPSIARDLNASTSTLQWVVDGYTLILSGLLLLGGTIGDRFGRRRWLAIGMVVFGAASAGAALATTSETLILMRGLQGTGAALVLPATLSIITDMFPREERAKAIGVGAGVGAMGLAIGPAVGGYLVDELSWSAVFWMHLPVVAAVLLGLRIVPESKDSRLLKLDIPGAVLATGGLLALVYALIQGSEAGWTSPGIVLAFVAGVVLLGGFGWVELHTKAPMLPLRFFKQRDFTGAVVIIGLVFFALMVTFFFLTQYFQLVQGKSAFTAGLYILPMAGMMMVGAPLSGILSRSLGPKVLVTAAVGAVAVGLAWLTQVDPDTGYVYIAVGLMTFGFGGGMGLAPLTDTVMAAVPVNDAGIGSAVNDVSRELGGTLGIAITGSIVSGIYSSNVESSLAEAVDAGVVDAAVLETTSEGIGVTAVLVESLPLEVATIVTDAANVAFVDAFTTGLWVSAGFMAAAVVVALTMLPRRMRATQADDDGIVEEALEAEAAYGPQPAPLPAVAEAEVA